MLVFVGVYIAISFCVFSSGRVSHTHNYTPTNNLFLIHLPPLSTRHFSQMLVTDNVVAEAAYRKVQFFFRSNNYCKEQKVFTVINMT